MKIPSMGAIGFGAVLVAALVLVLIGPPSSHQAPPLTQDSPTQPSPVTVTGNGFTLASENIDLPADDAQYPDGPHADVINANCTSCHSASMALNQPALSADQWKATVTKMREAYHAPVPEKDVSAIVAYLTALSQKQDGAPGGKAQDPAPKAKPVISDANG